MKTRLSLAVAAILAAMIVSGCSGISEEQAKNVDLKAQPVNPPTAAGTSGGEAKPGPGTNFKEAK
jgi:PBP1b-binding outer membrane lipoprotein LpoB